MVQASLGTGVGGLKAGVFFRQFFGIVFWNLVLSLVAAFWCPGFVTFSDMPLHIRVHSWSSVFTSILVRLFVDRWTPWTWKSTVSYKKLGFCKSSLSGNN